MATTGNDNLVERQQVSPLSFPIDKTGSNDINQGDQLYMDTSAHQAKVIATNGNAATFCGVAGDGSYIQPYSAKVYADRIPVWTKGVFRFKTTNGETYTDGNAVYLGADAQTISNVDPGSGNKIGYIKLAPGITSLSGAAGVTVEVQITPLWPVTSA